MKNKPMPELKNCPFCGGAKNSIIEHDHVDMDGKEVKAYNASCRYVNCHGEIYSLSCWKFKTKEEAIAAWNTRHDVEILRKKTRINRQSRKD